MSYRNEKDKLRRQAYQKDYHWKHREETNKRSKDYYQTHKEERKIKDKDYHQKHKTHRNEMNKKWKHELREKLAIEIGSKCCVCGSEPKSPIYHEKNFKPHLGLTSKHSGESNPKYILDHKEDFVCLCRLCHTTLHRFYNFIENFKKLLS